MGGNVAVTVKKPNGEVIKMDRWTNIIPYYLTQYSLYQPELFDQWFEDFTQQWSLMKEDYEKNKDTGQFQHNMTSVYFPFDTTSPSEYGLIVIDAQKKKIYSAQDYCNVGCFTAYKLEDEDFLESFEQFSKVGQIKTIEYYDHEKGRVSEPLNVDMQTVLKCIQAWLNNRELRLINEDSTTLPEILLTMPQPFCDPKKMNVYHARFPIENDWTFFKTDNQKSRIEHNLELLAELIKDNWEFSQEDWKAWKIEVEQIIAYLKEENDIENIHLLKANYNKLAPENWKIKD